MVSLMSSFMGSIHRRAGFDLHDSPHMGKNLSNPISPLMRVSEEAAAEMVNGADGLIRSFLRSRSIRGMDHADLMQEMRIACLQAAREWDPDKGSWPPWARLNMHSRFFDLLRAACGPGAFPADPDLVADLSGPSSDPDPNDGLEAHRLLAKLLRHLLPELTPLEMGVLRLRMIGGLTYREAARRIPDSPKFQGTVDYWLRKIRSEEAGKS